MSELKDCPFCGSHVVVEHSIVEANDVCRREYNVFFIECDECELKMTEWGVLYSSETKDREPNEVSRKDLVKRWNTREYEKKISHIAHKLSAVLDLTDQE